MKEVIEQLRCVKEKLAFLAKDQVPELAFDVEVLDGCVKALSAQHTMEKEYLVSYHFQTQKTEGFAHCVIRVDRNLKTSKGIKYLKKQLDRNVGGTAVILNIVELDIEE